MQSIVYRILTIVALILFITILQYFMVQDKAQVHVIYRELYFLPIILAAFWFGLRGGLFTALLATSLYLPMVIGRSTGFAEHDLGNLLEVLLFNIIGILVGWLRDREKIHQEVRRKEEGLAAMGTAIACVAHDMKTPLIAIGGFVRQIRRKLPEEDSVGKRLDIILHQTERLESMVRGMLAFASPLELNCQDDDPDKLFQETVSIAEEKAKKHNVQLSFQLQKNGFRCHYDFDRLQQALLNLINNAVEASPVGEMVVVRTRTVTDQFFIEVEDCGEGIPCDQLDKIVQPFVSHKKEGTGLGLPIVKKIAEAHGGSLKYEARNGKGMIFSIILPISIIGKNDSGQKLSADDNQCLKD